MKRTLKTVLVLALTLAVVFTITACGSKESTKEAKTYKVAMEPTFPPFDTTDEKTGDLTGFDVDMMEAIAKDQGFKLEWSSLEFGGLIPALEAGNIDIVASGMNASAERKKQVDFSDTYYDSGLVVAVKEDNDKIKSINDLTKDMKVGAQIGTTGADKVKKLKEDGKISEAKIYNGLDVAVQDLKNGTISALINDKPVTEAYMKKQSDVIKIVGKTLNAESYGIAVKKGNTELLDQINEGMQNIKDSGEFDKIFAKWFD